MAAGSKFGGRWVKPKGFLEKIWIPTGATYDEEKPTEFEDFCSELVFPDGFREGEPIRWAPWQLLITRQLLGVRWTDSGLRVIRKCLFVAGRGNAKTTLLSAFGLYGLLDPDVLSPSVDLVSMSRETAHRMFRVIANLVRANPELDAILNVSAHTRKILATTMGGELVVRSGQEDAEMGLNPSLALIDEVSSIRSRGIVDAIATAFGKRSEGAMVMMTTPALDTERYARLEYENAKQIQADRSLDPTYLPVIYEAAEDDDIYDPKTWRKANPGIASGFLSEQVIAQEAADCKRDATRVHPFKVLRLAQWSQAGGGFLDMTAWNDCATDFYDKDGELLVDFTGMDCYAGLDMAGTTDLASLALVWYDDQEDVAWVLWRHWSTEAMADRLNEQTGGQWNVWAQSDSVSLRLFPGDWISADGVAAEVMDYAERYRPKAIGIDSYRAKTMNQLLGVEGGLPVDQLSQTGRAMQAATERTQTLVGKRRLFHNGDPVARWCAANTEVKIDAMGFPKIQKRDRALRIDAMSALTMAIDRRLAWERDGKTGEAQVFIWEPPEPSDGAERASDGGVLKVGV